MPNTLLIETSCTDQYFTLRHHLMIISMLSLFFTPWMFIIMLLVTLHLITATPAILIASIAVVVVAIPGLLHLVIPAQPIDQEMTTKVC